MKKIPSAAADQIPNSKQGVTLLLAILLLASILAISFSLTTILFIEIRSSNDLLKTEGAFYAAGGVGEQALFNLGRKVASSTYVSQFNNNAVLNGPPTVVAIANSKFTGKVLTGSTFSTTRNKYDFCGNTATTSGCSYGKVTVDYVETNAGSDSMYAYLCQWDPDPPYGTYTSAPCSVATSTAGYWAPHALRADDGSVQLTRYTNPSVSWTLDLDQQQELIITNPTGLSPIYFSVSTFAADGTTPKGLPYVGKTSVVINTQNGPVGRKIQVLVPNFTPTAPVTPPSFSATGGAITYTDSGGLNPRSSPPYTGGYAVHAFTSNGPFTVSGSPADVEYLVVGGGGGGGGGGGNGVGGGGGGGVAIGTVNATPQSYSIIVAGGGAGSPQDGNPGANGGNSVFGPITAFGGGGGGGYVNITGNGGGSGGGGAGTSGTGGSGVGGQGNNGGTGTVSCAGAGGGGAGALGANSSTNLAGAGGNGLASSISGSSVTYGGGGGGGSNIAPCTRGVGGSGGGGNGQQRSGDDGSNGSPNTGGGGGGTAIMTGHNGGSGIVIIRYPTP